MKQALENNTLAVLVQANQYAFFKDGKMWMQDYTEGSVAGTVHGDLKQLGVTEDGGIVFTLENFVKDPKVWPHDKMYGVFQEKYGEEQIFRFLEMALSPEPIKTLEDGIHGPYFVGASCENDKICNFSHAKPSPDFWINNRAQSPVKSAKELFFLQ